MITPIPNRVRSRGPSALRSWNSGSSVSRMDCSRISFALFPYPPLSDPVHNPYTHDKGHSTCFCFFVLYGATCAGSMWVSDVLCIENLIGAPGSFRCFGGPTTVGPVLSGQSFLVRLRGCRQRWPRRWCG